jgi:hypothetical protein
MAKLIHSAIASVDGYIEDDAGSFDWAAPDQDVLRFVNDLERPVPAWIWTCWTRTGSQTVLSTSGTAPSQRDHSRGQEFIALCGQTCRRRDGAPALAGSGARL